MHSSITSITRYGRPESVMNFARSTTAVESGFIAAGITVSFIAGVGSLAAILSWVFFG